MNLYMFKVWFVVIKQNTTLIIIALSGKKLRKEMNKYYLWLQSNRNHESLINWKQKQNEQEI